MYENNHLLYQQHRHKELERQAQHQRLVREVQNKPERRPFRRTR